MDAHKATFEIESKDDAYAIERVLSELYDSLREESRSVRNGTGDSAEMLEEFKGIRDAARRHNPGNLTVVYEQQDEPFGESR